MDKEDDITFVDMPQWGALSLNSKEPQGKTSEEKEYDSLYSELLDKVHPRKFSIESCGLDKFNVANEIYAEIVKCGQNSPEGVFVALRNRAIDELGIRFSTKKKLEYLKSILSPEFYYDIQPYDKDLVAEVGGWYQKLIDSQDDIRGLEQIEERTLRFQRYKEELDYEALPHGEYLEKYPNGIHSEQIRLEKEEKVFFETNSPKVYLRHYPNGKFVSEAEKAEKVEKEEILLLLLTGILIITVITMMANH